MVMAAAESQFHVLAVDDSIIDRKLIERLLKTSSYRVTTVDSGSKALEFLGLLGDDDHGNPNQPCICTNHSQEVAVNLVITDYCMPGMTGYDLLKRIKESSSLRNIPVVIMSSENVPSRISRCLQEGAEEFFLKPVRLSDLNKLKTHMMKTTKCKNHQMPENLEDPERPEESTATSSPSAETSEFQSPQSQPQLKQQQQQQQQSQANNTNNNKRKAVEEGLSPDRARPRYSNDLTVVSN